MEKIIELRRSTKDVICVEQIEKVDSKILFDINKRIFDTVVSFILLILLFIPMCLIALFIRLDSPGNPIFSQIRLGKDEVPFKIYKFRTMCIDAEKDGIQWAKKDDDRITRLGAFLRKSRLDELPQLVNILLGQMSFVGPRPERPEFYDLFDTYIVGFRQRTKIIPGLTGHAQVNGGYDLLPEEKIVYDIEYMKNRCLLFDIKIILRTIGVVFNHKGAR